MATAQLNISLPKADLDRIREEAQDAGLPISRFVREKVLAQSGESAWGTETIETFDVAAYCEELNQRIAKLERLAENSGAM